MFVSDRNTLQIKGGKIAMGRNETDILIPAAADALERLKFEVANEFLGLGVTSEPQLRQTLDRAKFEVAAELGVPLKQGYNGDLTSRQTGAIGGRLGGHLGGQMVKRMIALAESQLAGRQSP
jgi:small acid-soluble spore protein D (minor alpha/beta-type SASP)